LVVEQAFSDRLWSDDRLIALLADRLVRVPGAELDITIYR